MHHDAAIALLAALTCFAHGLVLLGLARHFRPKCSSPPKPPLPPGPRPLPVIGNLRDLPKAGEREWEHWTRLREGYGPISSLNVFGRILIIINDATMAVELLEKRANLHSSRPRMTFCEELCGWSNIMVFQPPARLRASRKQFHLAMGTQSALSRFSDVLEVETHRFLLRVLEHPDQLLQHVRTEAGAIILKVAYGYSIVGRGRDPMVDLVNETMVQFGIATAAGAWLVDVIPALKFLPDWLPGMQFKKTARRFKATLLEMADKPIRFVKQAMANGSYEPSVVSQVYDKVGRPLSAGEEDMTKYTAASMYAGGADTSVSSVQAFFLAMMLNPEVQSQANDEIQRVVGDARLPQLSDRPHLPYVEAVVKEVFRWHAIIPLGIPHATVVDDICHEYLIPKGATLMPNIWWFTHDPDTYPSPSAFLPERFLGPRPQKDPRDYVFGFGRRACPGRLLADASVWLTVAKCLATFRIGKPVDANGDELPVEPSFDPGTVSHPTPFAATVCARSRPVEDLIRQVETSHPWDSCDAEALNDI